MGLKMLGALVAAVVASEDYYLVHFISSKYCVDSGKGYVCQKVPYTQGSPFITNTRSGKMCTTCQCSGSSPNENCDIESNRYSGSSCSQHPCPHWVQHFKAVAAGSGSNKHKHGLMGTNGCKDGLKLVKGNMQGGYPVDKDFQAFINGCVSMDNDLARGRWCTRHLLFNHESSKALEPGSTLEDEDDKEWEEFDKELRSESNTTDVQVTDLHAQAPATPVEPTHHSATVAVTAALGLMLSVVVVV
mmetsp:Transcript_31340/g.68665  ORF Transcript_31340/g.68665 Transcript_31340/m.68665 type:complete len:245 (+) Transcript_31340:60-794(+)|eukprot:CAMPEP_0204270432 /NCGR_PEP_ID=MMETSP0468-20130131/18896_1 /ASSEMBLY_ACC=CAM_ASM_000383 /TAXON_ID=2969 /ORGANISM="Oxyrrhis marina" /LENGTH=244 /DNA_ID=CAMNT_0051245971 /DNA_START=1 /DNA_END=735 /DNA_ORIENTATION=-